MEDPEEIHGWDQIICKVIKWSCHDFPEMDQDELYQDLWEYVLTRKHAHPNLNYDTPNVTTALQRRVKKGCWDQRKEQLQYSAQYMYRTTDVRRILETVFHYLEWPEGWVPDDAESADGMAPIDIRADIITAISRLKPPQYKAAIIRRFRDGIEDPTGSPERKCLNRAIQRLTAILNWYYPQGTEQHRRRPMSAAQAAYTTRRQEGES